MVHQPKFTISFEKPSVDLKSRFTVLSKRDRIVGFLEKATISEYDGINYFDTSDQDNIKKAKSWFNKHLFFLSHEDEILLRKAWEICIDDPRCTKMFFTTIKELLEKYE